MHAIANVWRSLTPLANNFCSGDSPRWFEGLLWFSDLVGAAVHTADRRGSVTTLPLPGHTPRGLGFRPDGSLLIASGEDRCVLRYDGESLTTIADLSGIAPGNLGDMVVDDLGRAYIGCQASEEGAIVRVDPDGGAIVAADGLECPSGLAITSSRDTLIVAESAGHRLTAFGIAPDGSLCDRTVFAAGLDGAPGGITLDAEGAVWASMTSTHQFQRIVAGGAVTDRIDMGDRNAIACTLGGPERRLLFLLSAVDDGPQPTTGPKPARLDAVTVDIPGAGRP